MINRQHLTNKLIAIHRAGSSSGAAVTPAAGNRQSGASMFGILMLLILLAILMNVGLTLGPHYMDNRAIVNIIESIDPKIWQGKSKKKMHEAVGKGLKVNSIRSLKSEDIIAVAKTQSGTDVKLAYEVRENMWGNVDVVLVWDKGFNF